MFGYWRSPVSSGGDGGLKPDHNTLARFRKDNGEQLQELFKDSVRVCCESGLVFLSTVSVDGTKIVAATTQDAQRKGGDEDGSQ